MDLEITQQRAVIEITTQKAKITIKHSKPKFQIKQTKAKMEIKRKLPTLKVDSTNFKSDIGLTPILKLTKKLSEEALQKGLEAIGQIAEDGSLIAAIERKGNPIADIAISKGESKAIDINVGTTSPSEFNWDPGFFYIDWQPHQIFVEWDVEPKVEIVVEPHKVQISLKKHPEVKISYKPKSHPKTEGKKVDRYI